MKRAIAFAFSAMGTLACAATPTALPMKPEMVNDLSIDQRITIQNLQTTDEELRGWTESLTSYLGLQLAERGASIAGDAPLSIGIRVTDTFQNFFHWYWLYKCCISFETELGAGPAHGSEVCDVSGLSLQRACDFCVTKSVAQILNDQATRSYLETPSARTPGD